jgi:Cytochrome P450
MTQKLGDPRVDTSDLASSEVGSSVSHPYYDPYDHELNLDPYPVWQRLREEVPLYRNDRYDFWALSRFEDVLEASLDHDHFSSARGTILEMMRSEMPVLKAIAFMDPPEHTSLRALASRAFTRRRIDALEPEIRRLVRGYLEPLEGSGGFDYVTDFGEKVPMMVISSMLGVPEADREQIRQWTDQVFRRDPGEIDAQQRIMEIGGRLAGYFAAYVSDRRRTPCDDMMTDLLHAELEGSNGEKRRLTDEEVMNFVMLIAGAGNETVARLLGWAGDCLARFPEEREKLVARPGLIPNAVEELLRFEAPSPVQGRTVRGRVTRHGVTVPDGAVMLLLSGSAGRDPRQYEHPDRLDVERKINRHVSFGYGAHFCLGASLARLEGRIALEETLTRFPRWQVDWSRAERIHTSTVRGYAKLPIRF